MRVVVITWDGGSNRQPFEMICKGLIDHEIEVHVLSHDAHREVFEGLGAMFSVLPIGEKPPGFRPSPLDERARVTGVWLSEEIAHAVIALLETGRFDMALVDVSMLTAFVGCEATSTRFVAVHHTLPGVVWSGPRREVFEAFVPPVNDVRRSLALPLVTGFADLMSRAMAHIVPTAAVLDEPAPWPLLLHYVGPLQPATARADIPMLPSRFVLVSYSTTWQRQVDVLQKTIDALAPLDHEVVVTTGPAVGVSEVTPAPNTIVFDTLPHDAVLERVDAVVTHAGHGTVLSALAAGVPLVCVPMGRDQHDVTRRVVAVGAGVEVDHTRIVQDLLAAVQHVIDQRNFADAAAKVAKAMTAHGGIDEALTIIERCARSRNTRGP